uniref:Uncharacterized protein n=1 Tax=Ditylenchus dipsaci TaxID=166011 RepID=A0A915EWU2_9BILA
MNSETSFTCQPVPKPRNSAKGGPSNGMYLEGNYEAGEVDPAMPVPKPRSRAKITSNEITPSKPAHLTFPPLPAFNSMDNRFHCDNRDNSVPLADSMQNLQ